MKKKIVYIDMDGVIVNFGHAIQDWFEKHPHLEERWKDMPDHIQGLFRNPPPVEGAIEAINKLHESGEFSGELLQFGVNWESGKQGKFPTWQSILDYLL